MEQSMARFSELENKTSLTYQEAREAYNLSLELLKDFQTVTLYKQKYIELVHAFFLELSLNITDPKAFQTFIEEINEWYENVFDSAKELFIALILQQKSNIYNFQMLARLLNYKWIRIEEVQSTEWISRTQAELILNIKIRIKNELKREHLVNIAYEASTTNDISFAKEILSQIPFDRNDLKYPIELNIAKLTVPCDFEKAISMTRLTMDKVPISTIYSLYCIAQLVYPYDQVRAKELIDELPQHLVLAFDAFIAAYHSNLPKIEEMISYLDVQHNHHKITLDNYEQQLVEIALAIATYYPLVAYSLLDKIQTNWHQVLEVQAKVAIALFPLDFEHFYKVFQEIDVEECQVEILKVIIPLCINLFHLKQLLIVACAFENRENFYQVMKMVHQ